MGVNGAGKSTLLNILAGIDDRYQGEVIIAGKNLRTEYEEAKQKVALVSEKLSYFMDKTPLENGELLGVYFERWSMEELYLWLDRLEVPKGQPIYQLSKGMYMKYQLAFAMSYQPEFCCWMSRRQDSTRYFERISSESYRISEIGKSVC